MEGEGCNPGVAMDSGNPLLKAVYLRRLRLTRLLLEGGAYVNESDHLGQTPLMTACRTQHTDSQCASRFKLVQFLLEKGADPNIQDKEGKSALMHACRENAGLEVVSLLLASGADISLEDQSGTSALVYAVMAGDWKVLKLLLDTCKAKGKEVIIITTDQFPCGKLQAKQYLSIPTIAPLNPNQTDKMISGPASPSEIQLITSPKCNSTSLCPPKNVFSFKDDQNCGVSSHPSSPSRFQRLGKGKGPQYGLQQPLLRLNSEPWLKIPASLSHESVKDLNKTEEFSLRIPTPDGYKSTKSTMDSVGKDLLNQTGDFCLRIPTIDGPNNCADSTMDNFELYEQQLAREKLEEEEEDDVNNKYGGQKISLPGLLSAHSVSHPNLHSSNVVTVSNSISQSLSVGKNLNHMASSSLQSIIQRRKLGADIYSSDPQLSVDLRNLPEDSNQRSRLAPLRCSSTMGSRESVVLLTSGPNRRVLSGLERRGSGAYLLDHHSSTSQARPRSLPPLLLKTNSQLNVCNVSSSAGSGFCEKELGLKNYHPCAPPGHPKDTTKRMLQRRHSMQTEQFKSTA